MEERDHRQIAKQQELLMFSEFSPGCAFWLPHGARIYNKLMDLIKDEYKKRGYQEVISPNMFKLDLFKRSSHVQHYSDDMFCLEIGGGQQQEQDDSNQELQQWALKPMNCPGHCLIFSSRLRSHNDLPLRFADFGVLHRNELSGALKGLFRVRRFQQDDAHIFCRQDQIQSEVLGALNFMKDIYNKFGMRYELALSSKPNKAIGDAELWIRAESALAGALNDFAGEENWNWNPGDGAFYGPKIDVKVMDARGRPHQCGSIQLDFQLPQEERMNLKYKSNDDGNGGGSAFKRPVMIHRAILGSVERMFAVLCEHYNGNWPLWLSPRQVMIVPIHAGCNDYCEGIKDRLDGEGFYVDLDSSKLHFKQKIGNAFWLKYNYLFVVGNSEQDNGSIKVRVRGSDDRRGQEMKVEDAINMLKRNLN